MTSHYYPPPQARPQIWFLKIHTRINWRQIVDNQLQVFSEGEALSSGSGGRLPSARTSHRASGRLPSSPTPPSLPLPHLTSDLWPPPTFSQHQVNSQQPVWVHWGKTQFVFSVPNNINYMKSYEGGTSSMFSRAPECFSNEPHLEKLILQSVIHSHVRCLQYTVSKDWKCRRFQWKFTLSHIHVDSGHTFTAKYCGRKNIFDRWRMKDILIPQCGRQKSEEKNAFLLQER